MKQNFTLLFFLAFCISIKTAAQTVSGTVWGDANGNGTIDAGEGPPDPTNTLYICISEIDQGVLAGTAVVAPNGTYTVSLLDGASSGPRLFMLTSVDPVSGPGSAFPGFLSSTVGGYLVLGLAGTMLNLNGENPTSLTTDGSDMTGVNVAIDKIPVPIPQIGIIHNDQFTADDPGNGFTISGYQGALLSVSGTTLEGTDYEDCPDAMNPCTTGSTFIIESINGNTTLAYGNPGVPVTIGQELLNFDPSLLYIYGQNGTGELAEHLGFTYQMIDKTGVTSSTDATFDISTDVPLPIKLIDFEVHAAGPDALITWITTFEANSSRFDVQQSTDGKNFNSIGQVKAAGNSSTSLNYQYTDAGISKYGVNAIYYRLREVDLDGHYTYSDIRLLKLGDRATSVRAFPNPFQSILSIDLPSEISGNTDLRLFDLSGQQVYYQQANIGKDQTNIVISDLGNLGKGLYILSVRTDKTVQNIKVMKN